MDGPNDHSYDFINTNFQLMKTNKLNTWLVLAGIYNLLWGSLVIIFPNHFFTLGNLPVPTYPMIWQSVGMIVGVYGIGYLIAATDPFRHWPIVLVGFLGKIFGPVGFLFHVVEGNLPIEAGVVIVFNDLIWWIPFFNILRKAFQKSQN